MEINWNVVEISIACCEPIVVPNECADVWRAYVNALGSVHFLVKRSQFCLYPTRTHRESSARFDFSNKWTSHLLLGGFIYPYFRNSHAHSPSFRVMKITRHGTFIAIRASLPMWQYPFKSSVLTGNKLLHPWNLNVIDVQKWTRTFEYVQLRLFMGSRWRYVWISL